MKLLRLLFFTLFAMQISAHSSHATAKLKHLFIAHGEVGVHLPSVLRDLTLDFLIDEVNPLSRFAAGMSHTCVILGNGTVRCWGDNSRGQSTVPPDLEQAQSVAAGGYHGDPLVLPSLIVIPS